MKTYACPKCGWKTKYVEPLQKDISCFSCKQGMKKRGVGVGTRLQSMISWFIGNKRTGKCGACRSRVAQMNLWGPEGCRRNKERILRWLKHSAAKANLPYVRPLVEILLIRAIKEEEQCDGQ